MSPKVAFEMAVSELTGRFGGSTTTSRLFSERDILFPCSIRNIRAGVAWARILWRTRHSNVHH